MTSPRFGADILKNSVRGFEFPSRLLEAKGARFADRARLSINVHMVPAHGWEDLYT